MNQRIKKINDLKQLRLLVSQTEAGLKEHVYDRLTVGDMWWIPNITSGFGPKEGQHPWVVINGYKPNRPPILACPRSSKISKGSSKLFMPANLLPMLDKEGVILLAVRNRFPVDKFREFEYIGRLPDEWIQKIRNGIAQIAGSIQ